MDKQNLKPCPKCGGRGVIKGPKQHDWFGTSYFVEIVCEDCNFNIDEFGLKPENAIKYAIELWNER